jgi:GTP cyclohydrolase IIa
MGVGTAKTPYEAQKLATEILQEKGGSQSAKREEKLGVDSLVKKEDSFVQMTHIDINGITESSTDIIPAFDTNFLVNKAQHYLMTKLIQKGALLFFIGGDNFMSPCNELKIKELKILLQNINDEIGIALKAGVGRSNNAEDAVYMADLGLEEIRKGTNQELIHVLEKYD